MTPDRGRDPVQERIRAVGLTCAAALIGMWAIAIVEALT